MENKSKIIFRTLRISCVLLAILLLFSGCTLIAQQKELESVKKWLEEDFSFTMSYHYMDLARHGTSQQTTQVFAADGSWSMINQRKVWNHSTDYNSKEIGEFYYRYENSQLICYSSIDGQAPQRMVVSNGEKAEMDRSKAYLVGAPALLPVYLEGLSVTQTDSATILTFQLPVEKLIADSTVLSVFINNTFTLAGQEYKNEYNAVIFCTLEADPQTLQPKSLSYDFSQLKPYLLSSGAQSGEEVLDSDFITMTYTFDYDLPNSIQIPIHLIP